MYRFTKKMFVCLALFAVAACGDNQDNLDAAPTPDAPNNPVIDAPAPDIDAAVEIDAMVEPDGIQDALDTPDGPADVGIVNVYVTYSKPEVGNDGAGFFVQRDPMGPAIFVAVDPATLTPVPAVGDRVDFTVMEVVTTRGLKQAIVIDNLVVNSSGNDLTGLVQDVSDAADLVTMLDSYTSEYITVTGTFTSGFSFAGTGHRKADFDTAALIGDPDLALRMPEGVSDMLTATYMDVVGCSFTTNATPLWRFDGEAQASVWDINEIAVTCPAPTVVDAVATGTMAVRIDFSRPIDPASINDLATQFGFDNGLSASAFAVNNTAVTLTTTMQDEAITYTVTVDSTVTDTLGTGVDAGANSATFDGFIPVPPPTVVVNEVDYDQPGGDTTEFIELYNYGAGDANLDNLMVAFINGSNSSDYATVDLSGTLAAGEYLVIGNAAVQAMLPAGTTFIMVGDSSMQNGAPDGVALVDTVQQTLIDGLSYEGAINGVQVTGFAETFDLVAGTMTAVVDNGAQSIARVPNGSDTGDDATDWVEAATPTPGASN